MGKFVDNLYRNQSLFFKIVLWALSTVLIVYLFPKGGKFKYEITKGKPWQYENLYAPFNFAILKTAEEIEQEKEDIRQQQIPYYEYDATIAEKAKGQLTQVYKNTFGDSIISAEGSRLLSFSRRTLNDIYEKGILKEIDGLSENQIIYLKKGNSASEVQYGSLIKQGELRTYLNKKISDANLNTFQTEITELFFDILKPNVVANEALTRTETESRLNEISYTRGSVTKDSRIIARGEVVEGDKFKILNSLKAEYESQVWSQSSYYWVILGYTILVSLALLMLLLYIKRYRRAIFDNNTQITFIFFNVLVMVVLTTLVLDYNPVFVYLVPICILPLTLKAFFDARLGLFTHIITVLLLGFIVPNSYEYMFLQILAGIVTILTVSELYKRANLFISVAQITLVYVLAYFAFTVTREGMVTAMKWETLSLFVFCGLATLFVQPLIYAYEKLFGMVSDMSLLELSDTNSKLLKEMANVAPGTFHHSLNVANLAEAAANEIGANAMLVRVGALYHDIGKMKNPTYFTENQTTSVNPHNDLEPQESARVIVDHVLDGIEIAKKNKLPDRIIDFIRTHHGTSSVYYFYMQAKKLDEDVDITQFSYPGPIPFSKETAILIMSDSVEAASKSLKEPTATLIDGFVEKIVNKQMAEGQFLNANITFKEIQMIKKVLKRKLNNIYHLRIEYPE